MTTVGEVGTSGGSTGFPQAGLPTSARTGRHSGCTPSSTASQKMLSSGLRCARWPAAARWQSARARQRDEALDVLLLEVGVGRPGRLSVVGEPGLERLDS
jgi:hypothetical protein